MLFSIKKHEMKNVTKLVLVLVILFSINSSFSQKKENDWKKGNLKGKVKSYTDLSYTVEDGTLKKVKKNNGGEAYKGVYQYDNKGNLTELIYFDENEKIILKKTCKYNEKGNIIESIYFDPLTSTNTTELYKYDDKENMIESISSSSNNSHTDKTIYTYNKEGNMIGIAVNSNENGSFEYRLAYEYDEKGNIIESAQYNDNESMSNKYFYKRNPQGIIFKIKRYLFNESIEYKTIAYKYDENGNIIEHATYDAEENLKNKFSNTYNYAEKGNWTKKTKIENGVQISVTKREYEYYK